MDQNLLEVKNVCKKFREGPAIENISFTAGNGNIIGFVGHNGSGKTALFKCICGFYQVTQGEILINNHAVGSGEKMPRNIAFTIEEPAFLGDYSGRKNLEFLYELRHRRNPEYIENIMNKVKLDYHSNIFRLNFSLTARAAFAILPLLRRFGGIYGTDQGQFRLRLHAAADGGRSGGYTADKADGGRLFGGGL